MSEGEWQREIPPQKFIFEFLEPDSAMWSFKVIQDVSSWLRGHKFHPCASIFPPLDHLKILLQIFCHKTFQDCCSMCEVIQDYSTLCCIMCQVMQDWMHNECFSVHESFAQFSLMWLRFPKTCKSFPGPNPNLDLVIFHFSTFRQLIIFADSQSLVNRTLTRHQSERSVQFLSASLSDPRLHRRLAVDLIPRPTICQLQNDCQAKSPLRGSTDFLRRIAVIQSRLISSTSSRKCVVSDLRQRNSAMLRLESDHLEAHLHPGVRMSRTFFD